MANIDYQLLRDWYSSNYYTGIPQSVGNKTTDDRKIREFFKDYVLPRPIEIDPRVKYRIANKAAINQFDNFGEFSGTSRYSNAGNIPAVFFSQGQPLHQYALGSLIGRGTSVTAEQPFLIATLGDSWGSSATATELTKDQISGAGLSDALYERVDEETRSKFTDLKWSIERLKREIGGIKTVEQLDAFFDKVDEVQSMFSEISTTVDRHIWGDQGTPDLQNFTGIDEIDEIYKDLPESIHDFAIDRYNYQHQIQGNSVSKLTRDSIKKDLSSLVSNLGAIEKTFNIDSNLIKKFNVLPVGQFSSGRTMYGIPDWVRANVSATSLQPSDTELLEKIQKGLATPEEIEKVYGLGGLRDWRGGGGALKKLFIQNPNSRSLEKVGNIIPSYGASMGAMTSEVLPRTIIEDSSNKPIWSVTSPSVEVGNYRPFAIWQYTKNGLKLINEGNNQPVLGGVKPIPTDKVDPELIGSTTSSGSFKTKDNLEFVDFFGIGDKLDKQNRKGTLGYSWRSELLRDKLSNMSVFDAVKRFEKQGWKRGFADTGVYTQPFRNLVNYMNEVPVPVGLDRAGVDIPATLRNAYLNNPEYRSAVNASTLGKVGTAAAVVTAPFDSISRRNAYENYLVDQGATPEDLMFARIPVGIASGLETAANFATFGLYDAFSPSVSAEANRKSFEDAFYRDLALRKYIQQGIDYPMIGGQQFERTTK